MAALARLIRTMMTERMIPTAEVYCNLWNDISRQIAIFRFCICSILADIDFVQPASGVLLGSPEKRTEEEINGEEINDDKKTGKKEIKRPC